MEQVEIGIEAGARSYCAVDLEKKIAEERAGDDTHGKAGHAHAGSQQPATQDDHDVVHDGSERGDCETSLGVLHSAENTAFVETELRGKHQAREENDARFFLGRKSGSDQACELRREDFAGEHEGDEQQAHEGHDGGEHVPAFVFAAFGGVLGEDGNERDTKRCAGNQII